MNLISVGLRVCGQCNESGLSIERGFWEKKDGILNGTERYMLGVVVCVLYNQSFSRVKQPSCWFL